MRYVKNIPKLWQGGWASHSLLSHSSKLEYFSKLVRLSVQPLSQCDGGGKTFFTSVMSEIWDSRRRKKNRYPIQSPCTDARKMP